MNDEFYVANEAEMNQLREEELEAIDGFLNKRKRTRLALHHRHIGKKIDTIENEIEASEDLQKNKMLVELNTPEGLAVKHIEVKPQTNVKCTTRFLAGKMLMFTKLSLKSFIYQLAIPFIYQKFSRFQMRLFEPSMTNTKSREF